MQLKATYDRTSDILYLSLGDPAPVEGDGLPRGVELDFSMDEGKPCGLTVIGFRKNGWPSSVSELATIVSSHLSVTIEAAQGTIIDATGKEWAKNVSHSNRQALGL